MKLEKMVEYLPDGTREILGYKVKGKEFYLMKIWYNHMSFYKWAICIDYPITLSCEITNKELQENKVIFCNSFKNGKQKLEKML